MKLAAVLLVTLTDEWHRSLLSYWRSLLSSFFCQLYPLNLCSHLSSFLPLAPGLPCILYLALMNSSLYVSHFFAFPAVFSSLLPLFPFLFLFLLCAFVFTSFGLLEDVAQRHVSGHWRTFRSQQERGCRALRGSPTCLQVHTHTETHTQTYKHAFRRTHTHAKLLNFAQRTRLPEGKMPQKGKQRGGIFSLCPPLSISFKPPLLLLSSLVVLCSAAQSWSKSPGF